MNPEYKYIKYKTKYMNLKLNCRELNGGAKRKKDKRLQNKNYNVDVYSIVWPAASDFLYWLMHHMRKNKIKYRSPNTDGDYSKTWIGTDPEPIQMDWKHLDISEIDAFSKKLEKYGWKIVTLENPRLEYHVSFKKIG